mmetsp:Transcript_19370/g.34986  ORF Transcript_19370/g.34986 Transcript_19370/m.34986 type:complete len:352 (-) Transcript_19370:202-1257(-)
MTLRSILYCRHAFRQSHLFQRQASTLLIVEHKDKELSPSVFNTLQAANNLKNDVVALVCGHDCSSAADLARKLPNIKKVFYVDHPWLKDHSPDQYATVIHHLHKKHNFSHILSSSSTLGRNVVPRVAAILDVQPITDVIEILDDRTFKRPIYAGNAQAILRYKKDVALKALTVRATSFPTSLTIPKSEDSPVAPVEELPSDILKDPPLTHCVSKEVAKSDRPDLTQAKIVVCGGRALKNKQNFEKHIGQLAEALGGAVGATRAAVDADFVSNDLQIGQTGKVVAPDVYFGFGVSGAVQHLAGMKDSKVIVAVNTDTDAPIFQIADYGLKEDVFKALPEILEEVKKLPPRSK